MLPLVWWISIAAAWLLIAINVGQAWSLLNMRRDLRRDADAWYKANRQKPPAFSGFDIGGFHVSSSGQITAQPPLYPASGWQLGGTTSGPAAQAPRITPYIPPNIQIHQFTKAYPPEPSLAYEDFTAPDDEEDVILTGWKRFDVSNGFLVSPVSGYVWHSPRLTASCPQLYNLGIGPEACTAAVPRHLQDPMAAHNCGIFAMKDPEDLNDPAYRRAIGAIAKVSLYGIVQEGTEGYAAEKCIIEEVYLPTGGKPIDGDEIEQLLYRYNVPVKEESPWT